MPVVTLVAKIRSSGQLAYVDEFLRVKLQGLKCAAKVIGATERGWVQADIRGTDEKVAVKYIEKEIGLCPGDAETIERFSTLKGRLVDLTRSTQDLRVDIGISQPKALDVAIPLQMLQAQLCDGGKLAMNKILELFGLVEDLPFIVKVTGLNLLERRIDGMIPEIQLGFFRDWTTSLLDRLLIVGATADKVELAVARADLDRDVLGVEPLGLFEQAVTCKFGTDAAGLIPRLGRRLRNATFEVFSGKRILQFLPDDTSWIVS